MGENKKFGSIFKSKFVKSVLMRAIPIYLVICVAVIVIVSVLFSNEINKNVTEDRAKQLSIISETITGRLTETTSIALSIGTDTSVIDPAATGSDLKKNLNKYLAGNDFIDYLAYYRLSDADRIYTTEGEYVYDSFWNTFLNFNDVSKEAYLEEVTATKGSGVISLHEGLTESYLTYAAVPNFTQNATSYIIILIPLSKIEPVLERQLLNGSGFVAMYDTAGKEVYKINTFGDGFSVSPDDFAEGESEKIVKLKGKKYILQCKEAASPNWLFVSAICNDDIMSDLANRELTLVILLASLMLVGVIAMLVIVIILYKPINKLASEVSDGNGSVLDEKTVLTDRFAALKDDSEQKQIFETAFHEAEAANKAKSAFLSSMSHDIRTPMNAIIGMTEIATKHLDDIDYVGECLQKVQVASQYLLDIINNVLDMSRIESGRFTLSEETIELPKLVYGLRTILNQSVAARHQRFIVEVENIKVENLVGDYVRLTQVFVNILSNSVKFTPNGGVISLNMRQTPDTEDGFADYVFTFKDNGIGMTPEFVEHVFDTFSRAKEADNAKVEGTGLGMAIVKSLVELMGGTVTCESERGVGTTFTVKLHMKIADAKGDEELDAQLNKYKNARVLVVCDDEELGKNQLASFENAGMVPTLAKSASDAVKKARNAATDKNPFKLVLINATVGDECGAKTATAIQAAVPDKTTYAFAAADLTDVGFAEAKDAGITSFVQTPLFNSTIMQALDSKYELPGERVTVEKKIVDLKGKKVLLVEDNNINREIACKIIGETTAEIFEAENGEEAVEAFRNHPEGYFDVILMDLQMPVMNGYEATAQIRATERPDALTVPIYAMTANTFDEDVRQVREAGMNGHIGKPYTPSELYKALAHALKLD